MLEMSNSRYEVEALLQALTGGASPKHGDTLIFNREAGWLFGNKFPEGISLGEGDVIEDSDTVSTEGHDHNPVYYTKQEIDGLLNSVRLPVGFILPTVSIEDPSVSLGYGTWERVGQGRVLVGLDESNPNFDEPGETGG